MVAWTRSNNFLFGGGGGHVFSFSVVWFLSEFFVLDMGLSNRRASWGAVDLLNFFPDITRYRWISRMSSRSHLTGVRYLDILCRYLDNDRGYHQEKRT